MRTGPLLLVSLLLLPLLVSPVVQAAPPKNLKTLNGSLGPGDFASIPWDLNRDLSEFLFHYQITGGAEAVDVVYVSIDEPGYYWDFLMGEGWAYCDCALNAGAYTVTVEADAAATGPISYSIGFYLVPQAPVDFTGFVPANWETRITDFGVLFPSSGSYTIVASATAGSYELFVDGESQDIVEGTRTLNLDLAADFHFFEVLSTAVSPDIDVRWTVQIQGQPKLIVSIVNPCPVLNPESGLSECVTGAEATASDGRTPTVTYDWTASGGELNSTSGQWVRWTAPAGVARYTLTVNAFAAGYLSDSDTLSVQVVPEFPPLMTPMLLLLTVALAAFAQRKTRNPPSR